MKYISAPRSRYPKRKENGEGGGVVEVYITPQNFKKLKMKNRKFKCMKSVIKHELPENSKKKCKE